MIKDQNAMAICIGSRRDDCRDCENRNVPIKLTRLVKGRRIPVTIPQLIELIQSGKATREWVQGCMFQQEIITKVIYNGCRIDMCPI